MKTATILPLLCVLAAAAPALNRGPVKDVHRRQTTDEGVDGLGNLLSGLPLGELATRQSSDGSDEVLGDILGNLPKRQFSHSNNRDQNGNNDNTLLNAVDGSRAGVNQNAQNISVAELRRKRQLLLGGESEANSGNGDNDENLLNLLDGSAAQADRNIQNVTILRRYQNHQSRHESVSLATKARRWLSALFGRAAPSTLDSDNGDDDAAVANALDGSAGAVDENAQDISVLRRRQGAAPPSTPTSSTSAVPSASAAPIAPAQEPAAAAAAAPAPAPRPALNAADGDNTNANDNNGDDDDALLNAADDSGAGISKNLQNITILKHRRGNINNNDDDNGDDDETLANILDGSGLEADDNADGVDVANL